MPTRKRQEEIRSLAAEVETVARRLRTEARKQAAHLPKDLKRLADQLRKGAARAAEKVEKYVHEIRVELEGETAKKGPARKRVAKKTTRRTPA